MKLKAIAIKTNPLPRRRKKKKVVRKRRRERRQRHGRFLVQAITRHGELFYLHANGKWKRATRGATKFSSMKSASDWMGLNGIKVPSSFKVGQVVPA